MSTPKENIMYHCKECGKKFERPKIVKETHNLNGPPFEKFALCPFCNSTNFNEIIIKHCHCCGARLKPHQIEFCSDECKITAEKLRLEEYKRLKKLNENPLVIMIKEVDEYNATHNTKFSYGQYVTLIKPKILKEEKCKTKKNI